LQMENLKVKWIWHFVHWSGLEQPYRIFIYIYLVWLQGGYSAEEHFRGCGLGGVSFGATVRKTDCGGKALLFAAAMR
jgi:hypothetical protein